jgi:Fic family protein
MDTASFKKPSGYLIPTVYDQRAFVPNPLPPQLDLSPVYQLLSVADQKLGELRGIGEYLPNPYLLIRPLQRKEAISSSNIEGTYTSLPELLMLEYGGDDAHTSTDTLEVYNYVNALQKGIAGLSQIPVSNRLIRQLHRDLLSGLPKSRSGHFELGEFRQDQNFIGRTRDISKSRFNPPPPTLHQRCMFDLEIFMNSENMGQLPPLVFLSLVHYQFETIHPFPDGNGRVGRLLLPLILCERGIMPQPLLYMSQFFEDNKDEYVDLMLRVSQHSEWIKWIEFFLKGVVSSCESTIDTVKRVRDLQENYKQRCQQARSSALLLQIVDSLFEKIATTVPDVRQMTGTSYTAAKNNVDKLVDYGILTDLGFSMRPKYYFAVELMKIFE